MPLDQKATGSHGHRNLEEASVDRPSQWREKYGSTSCTVTNFSHTDWIATMLDSSKKGSPISKAHFESLATDGSLTDEDAADVISQMNKLLDGVLPSRYTNLHYHDVGLHGKKDDFDSKFTSYLQINGEVSIGSHEEEFAGESMAVLFRRTHDEKLTKKCFLCLLSHTKESKLLRCRVFAGWYRLAIVARGADDVSVKKFQRHQRLRYIRRLFLSWLNLRVIARDIVLKKAAQIRKVLIAWRLQKSWRAAGNIRITKLMRSSFVGWLASTRENGGVLNSRRCYRCPHEVNETPCVTVEKDDSPANGRPNTPEKIVPSHTEAKDTSEPEAKQTKNVDGVENQPKRTVDKNLLIPVHSQRRTTGISSSNSNIVLKMNQRKEEREQVRAVLRQRHEQKAIERQQRLEEQKLRREERETREQRRFVQRRIEEEQRKKMAADHLKRACRLALLHYRISLQKRMLIQWKQVFRINGFQERKASLAWRTSLCEKCWRGWVAAAAEGKKKLFTCQQLAEDFDKRRLLAKAFAALEEYVNFSKVLVLDAKSRVLAHRRKSILMVWLRATNRGKAKRCASANEIVQRRFGIRLRLLVAVRRWRSGAQNSRKEREMELLIETKWKALGLKKEKMG